MGTNVNLPTKHRVQLDFTDDAFRDLNDLQEKLSASSRAEVIRNALAVLKWIYKKRVEQHLAVVAIDEANNRVFEPEFPFLPIR